MKISHRNKKGIDLSINMLVIVAMAIFALFLIVGFVLGGFSYFKGIFGKVATSPSEVAVTKCNLDLQTYVNQYGRTGAGIGKRLGDKLCEERSDAGDLDGDGVDNDPYHCEDYISVSDICQGGPGPGDGQPPI